MAISPTNPMGTEGFSFVEYTTPQRNKLATQFEELGFVVVGEHGDHSITHHEQSDVHFLINTKKGGHAEQFAKQHGAAACGMGFRVADAGYAYDRAVKLGAKPVHNPDLPLPAIWGVGGSVLYFVDASLENTLFTQFFQPQERVLTQTRGVGFRYIDHLTHNLKRGHIDEWADFYARLFNFSQIRYFDIKGQQTGLISRAMGSPCGKIKIPLNESVDDKSQIEEFIHEFKGEGIQHIALATENIFDTVEQLRAQGIDFMDVPDTYYEMIEDRLPNHDQDVARLHKNYILIDGNTHEEPKKLLLQIFTKTMLGPVFFEIIQRKGDDGFGEGNFQALFESIERDQIRRGVL